MTAHHFLATMTALKDLPPEELEHLAAHVTRRRFESGDAIVRQGESATECFVVASGSAAVTRRSEVASPTQPLAMLKAGDLFGEIALIDGSTRSATVMALEPTECLALPAAAILDLLQRNHAFSVALLRLAVLRLAEQEMSAG